MTLATWNDGLCEMIGETAGVRIRSCNAKSNRFATADKINNKKSNNQAKVQGCGTGAPRDPGERTGRRGRRGREGREGRERSERGGAGGEERRGREEGMGGRGDEE